MSLVPSKKQKISLEPPTPAEFLEIKRVKFARIIQAQADKIIVNNQAQIGQVIEAMRRGEDKVVIKSRPVGANYQAFDLEYPRFVAMMTAAFPLFQVIVGTDVEVINELGPKHRFYVVSWFVVA